MKNAPVNDSLGRSTYNGHRAYYEVDDGGPFYLTEDKWADQDPGAWDNAGKWALHYGLGGVSSTEIIGMLSSYADFLENLEVEGKLETNLPIEGTNLTSYSAKVREKVVALQKASDLNG